MEVLDQKAAGVSQVRVGLQVRRPTRPTNRTRSSGGEGMTPAVVFMVSGLVLSFLEASAGVLQNSRWARDTSVAVDSSRSAVTLKTRSALDCAITCGHIPACLLYAWDTGVAVCYIDPALYLDTTSPTSQKIYRKIYQVMGNETATGTWTTQGTTTLETTDVTSIVTTPRTATESTTTATSVTPQVTAADTTQSTASNSTQLTTSVSTYVTQTSTSTQTTLAGTSTVATTTVAASTTTKLECPVLVIANGSVTWADLSQREGSIVCNNDYMLSTDDISVLCLSNLTWHVGGECRLRIVRNVTLNAYYPIPRAVTTGWSTCVRGTLFYSGTDSRVSVKLAEDNTANNLLLMDFRVNYSSIVRQLAYNTKNNGVLDTTKFIGWTPFIVVGQNFTLKLTIKTSTNLDIFVDGTLRTTITYGRNLLNTLYVSAAQTVTMDTIDLWC